MPVNPNINGTLSYATEYKNELSQWFPRVLMFGDLYATPNNNRYRWTGSKTIEIPSIRTSGRTNGDRDSIGTAQRNYDNAWEPKTLSRHRKWSTLVHPKDIDETNYVASIANITQVFNETQKFPEMDCYTISKIYSDWTSVAGEDGITHQADTTVLTTASVLGVFDNLMLKMDNARVPVTGRILYVTNEVAKLLKTAEGIQRQMDITSGPNGIDRRVNRLDEVQIKPVPAELMKTIYDFTEGWSAGVGAAQINMFLVHPLAVITPVTYEFADLSAPSAVTEGKYYYYEESFEDVFILNKKSDAIQFNITASDVNPIGLGPDPANTTYPWTDKTPADFQNNIVVTGTDITGTLNFIEGGLSGSGPLAGDGYFLALKLTADDWSAYDSVKVGLTPSAGTGLVEIKDDPDHDVVLKITQQYTQDFVIQTTINGVTSSRMWALDRLNCLK